MRPRHPPENTKVPSLTGFAAKRAGLKSRLASGNRRNLSQPLRLGGRKYIRIALGTERAKSSTDGDSVKRTGHFRRSRSWFSRQPTALRASEIDF